MKLNTLSKQALLALVPNIRDLAARGYVVHVAHYRYALPYWWRAASKQGMAMPPHRCCELLPAAEVPPDRLHPRGGRTDVAVQLPGHDPAALATTVHFGTAICVPRDTFDCTYGRYLALGRALEKAGVLLQDTPCGRPVEVPPMPAPQPVSPPAEVREPFERALEDAYRALGEAGDTEARERHGALLAMVEALAGGAKASESLLIVELHG